MSAFDADQKQALSRLAALIIPASAVHDVPGADDPAILSDLLATAAPHVDALRVALAAFDADAPDPGGAFRATWPEVADLLQTLVVQCYYRDPRVMRALGMDARAPFPQGYHMDGNDFSLLEPVRARGAIFRDVP